MSPIGKMLVKNWIFYVPQHLTSTIAHTMTNATMFDIVQEETTLEDDSKFELFCGIAHYKLKESYNPYIGVFLSDFVFVCPLYTNIYHVWMGQALIVVQLDRNQF